MKPYYESFDEAPESLRSIIQSRIPGLILDCRVADYGTAIIMVVLSDQEVGGISIAALNGLAKFLGVLGYVARVHVSGNYRKHELLIEITEIEKEIIESYYDLDRERAASEDFDDNVFGDAGYLEPLNDTVVEGDE